MPPLSDQNLPQNLRYSERKLWAECPQARAVLERLARYRLMEREMLMHWGTNDVGDIARAYSEYRHAARSRR